MSERYVAGFDIDGVIGDFVTSFRAVVRDEFGVELGEEDIRGHDLFLALGLSQTETIALVRRTLSLPDYALYAAAREGLAELVEAGVEVHIVTARWNGQADAADLTRLWLAERGLREGSHFHRIDTVKEGSKHAIDAALDSFVDDNLVELIEMAERRPDVATLIVFNHPWNQTLDVRGRFRRVEGWSELVPLLRNEARRKEAWSTEVEPVSGSR